MGKFIDLTGQKFGRLTVVNRSGTAAKGGSAIWHCLCECGKETDVIGSSLRNGKTRSCGCLSVESSKKRSQHGGTNTRLYRIWSAMIERCHNPNNHAYSNYGGRGISVCDEWKNDFSSFQSWASSNGYNDTLTIDRKENNGSYCPDNCQWITRDEQQFNKRNNRLVTYKGVTRTATEWSQITGINRNVLMSRLNRLHWSDEKAIETPVRHLKPRRG